MAESTSPRLGLHRWGADTDTFSRDELDNSFGQLESLAAISIQGLYADRPTPSIRGRIYYAYDIDVFWYDTGSAWKTIDPTKAVGRYNVNSSISANAALIGWGSSLTLNITGSSVFYPPAASGTALYPITPGRYLARLRMSNTNGSAGAWHAQVYMQDSSGSTYTVYGHADTYDISPSIQNSVYSDLEKTFVIDTVSIGSGPNYFFGIVVGRQGYPSSPKVINYSLDFVLTPLVLY